MSTPVKGKKMNWSGIYAGDRPQSIVGLTVAQEALFSQIFGFVGKDQDGVNQKIFVMVFKGTARPTLTDFAGTPIGTIILTPRIASVFGYQHQAQTTTAGNTPESGVGGVVGDWAAIAKTTCT